MKAQPAQPTEFTLEEVTAWLAGLSDEARSVIETAIDSELARTHEQQRMSAENRHEGLTH